MSRLSDPTLCPDCRSLVRPDAVCSGCGLSLTGPLATELWTTMLSADALVERLRVPVPESVPEPARPLPTYPVPVGVPDRPALGARAVPVLLLSLGGLLVLTAVSIFLAVTWTVLPLAVKAVIMLAVTGGLGTLAVVLSRRALRGSAEAFWAITAALLALDLSAAHRSGLFGLDALSDRAMTGAGGLVVAAGAVCVALRLRTTPVRRSIAIEVAAGLGLLLTCAAWFWSGPAAGGASQATGVVALLAVVLALRSRAGTVPAAALGLAALSWLDLALVGIRPGLEDGAGVSTFWASLDWWPLVVAAALGAVVAMISLPVPGLAPDRARTVSAGAALAALGGLALLPAAWSTREVLAFSGVVVVLAAVVRFGPRHAHRAAARLGGSAAGVGLLGLVLTPLGLVLHYVGSRVPWLSPLDDRFPDVGGPATWTALAVAVAVLVLAMGARGRVRTERAVRLTSTVAAGGPVLLGLAVTTGLAGAARPLWLVVLGLLVTIVLGAGSAVRASGRARAAAAAVALEAAVLAITAASRSDLASALLAALLLLVCAAVFVRLRAGESIGAPVVLAGAALAAAYAVDTWCLVADLVPASRWIGVSLVAAAGLVVAGRVGRTSGQRIALEGAAALVGLSALGACLADLTVTAVLLTVLGSALAVSSVLRPDRRLLGWGASLVLLAATLVRLTTDHRVAPELYAAPAAALLLLVGVVHLARAPQLGSWPTLGSGLNLALVPSTLIALVEPDSWRTLVVLVGATIALAAGLRLHWQAPFLVGGAVLTALSLRFLLPLAASVLADPLGAWMLFGATGASLLVAGVLWEQSLRNLRGASHYVGALT